METAKNRELPFRFGATLYSFNREYYTYEKTFEDIMEDMSTLGPGTGIEIVLQQFERHYPDLSPEFEHRFKRALQKYGLVPTLMSGYDDAVYQPNDDAAIDYIAHQLKTAHELGFKYSRLLPPGRPRIYEQIAKYAEKYDVVCCCEIHCPNTLESPNIQNMLSMMDRIDSPYLGIFPDCGTMCQEPSRIHKQRFLDLGMDEKVIDLSYDMWKDKKPTEEIIEAVTALDKTGYGRLEASELYEYFGHGDPKMISECRRHIKHIHLKYYHIDDQGQENAVRLPEIVHELKTMGYTGSVSAEYEGHHWFAPYSAIDQIRRLKDVVTNLYYNE